MYSNFLALYKQLGAASPLDADQVAGRSSKVVALVHQSYRTWLGLMTESVGDASKAVTDLASCRSPNDLFAVQQVLLEASGKRAIANLNTLMELTSALVAGLGTVAAEATDDALKVEAAIVAPVLETVAAITVVAPKPAPVAAPAAAPVVVEAPAPAPAVLVPAVPAPVMVETAAPVEIVAPVETAAPEAAPAVQGAEPVPFVEAVANHEAAAVNPAAA
ncbi:MAG: hypothetical protein GC191_14565 [Azospirillum sp.]|nr:hypothetical protein [Azospirillum sp.]